MKRSFAQHFNNPGSARKKSLIDHPPQRVAPVRPIDAEFSFPEKSRSEVCNSQFPISDRPISKKLILTNTEIAFRTIPKRYQKRSRPRRHGGRSTRLPSSGHGTAASHSPAFARYTSQSSPFKFCTLPRSRAVLKIPFDSCLQTLTHPRIAVAPDYQVCGY